MNLWGLLFTLIILGLIFYLVTWFLGWIGLGEPFNKIAKVVIGVIFLLYLLSILAGVAPVMTVRL